MTEEEQQKKRMRRVMMVVMSLVLIMSSTAFVLLPWPYSLLYFVPVLFTIYQLVRIGQWYYYQRRKGTHP